MRIWVFSAALLFRAPFRIAGVKHAITRGLVPANQFLHWNIDHRSGAKDHLAHKSGKERIAVVTARQNVYLKLAPKQVGVLQMVSSRQRVLAAAERREPDRVPIDAGGSSVTTTIEVGSDLVFSHKPRPMVPAEDSRRPDSARHDLQQFLTKARGCRIEIIMKDISTVRYLLQRLWEWEKIAMDQTLEFA